MKTILVNADTYLQASPCVMALGYFDGVHLGHQHVIKMAREEAKKRGLPLALMSFSPHPINILSGGKRHIPCLTALAEKKKILKGLGVDIFYIVDFTLEFAALTPKQFVEAYLVKLGVVHAVAGFDFTYGAKGAGKLADINNYSKNQISVTDVECVAYLGEKISSTAIRQRLLRADVHEIPFFLGRYYSVKMLWDGKQLKTLEPIMLPNNGLYEVLLEQDYHEINAVVSVDQPGYVQVIKTFGNLTEGVIQIRWLQTRGLRNLASNSF